MPLDTEVQGDPNSLTATCDWIRSQSESASSTGDQVYSARGDSEAGWAEEAGEAARSVLTQAGKIIDNLTSSLDDTCRELQTHADDLRTVQRKMQRARDVAHEGGLTVDGYLIQEPGPQPDEPEASNLDGPPTPQQKQVHAAAVEAQQAHQKKLQAFSDASEIVDEARTKESDSQQVLVRFFSGVFDPVKLSISLADMSTSSMAAVATRVSSYHQYAEDAMSKADRASKVANSTNLSFTHRMRASTIQITNEVNANAAKNKATATRASRWVANRSETTQKGMRGLGRTLASPNANPANSVLRGTTKVGSKIPGLGLAFTGFGVGYDISSGKDPTKAVVSGGSSLGASIAVGALVGGPVGAIAGGVAGIGVGFVVDEFWPD